MKTDGNKRKARPEESLRIREYACQGRRIQVVFGEGGSLRQCLEELLERGRMDVPYGGVLPAVPGGRGESGQ